LRGTPTRITKRQQESIYSETRHQRTVRRMISGRKCFHLKSLAWIMDYEGDQPSHPSTPFLRQCHVVYKSFIEAQEQVISKMRMTRVEGENCRLRHYLARVRASGNLVLLKDSRDAMDVRTSIGKLPPNRNCIYFVIIIPPLCNANVRGEASLTRAPSSQESQKWRVHSFI
jgi:hypothetical protein